MITTKTVLINNTEYELSAVNNLTRVEINNRLHYLGDQILKLRMQQDELIKMREELDTKPIDLFNEIFEIT
jgi:hypothetical protein